MKKMVWLSVLFLLVTVAAQAQCSICTKTAEQLGEGPASGLNSAILYLMLTPIALIGYIGFRWWKKEKEVTKNDQ